jgi:hypothetical protein
MPSQSYLFHCLTVSGESLVAGSNAAPRYQGSSERRRFTLRWVLTRMQSWSRRHGIDGFRVAYFCTLFGCGVLFGLFVGGYVGYMDAATPAVDAPGNLTQLATSDGQWTAMVRQYYAHSIAPNSPPGSADHVSCSDTFTHATWLEQMARLRPSSQWSTDATRR